MIEVLQKVGENDNTQLIYSFLEQNLEKLDENLIEVLNNWAEKQFESVNTAKAIYIARVIANFSNLLGQFPYGNIATNKEIAIAGYKIGLKILTFEAFPVDWAMIQNNLGRIYRERIKGQKARNIEYSISAYIESLKVRTFDAFPKKWAETQYSLALAYRDRIKGDRANNIEEAIAACTEALKIFTFEVFPVEWAMTQNNLGNVYRDRIRGDRAENLEKAIATYKEALKVYTFEEFPVDLAMTQHNLALTYSSRIRGDKAENLEKAIATCKEALKVRTFDSFPKEWTETQVILANAFVSRIRGDNAENLEKAITIYKEALKVLTFEAFPQGWAVTQMSLATAYSERIRGDKAENLEKAIAIYKEALKVWTFDAFPWQWANTQNALGSVYRERIRGDKAENLEKAIAICTEALKVRTFEAFPKGWAETQNTLANVYCERIRGDKAENLEKAIAICTEALKVLTFEAFPWQWANTQNTIAIAYRSRIRGDKAENIEQSITAYKEALKVRTFEAFPYDWALIQSNLANAYSERIRGDKAENIEKAITAYKEALKVRTFEAFPYDWAFTQSNLTNAYSERIRGDKAENIEKAITAGTEALKVFTFEAFPQNCLRTAAVLGTLHYDQKQWQPATEAYHTAIEAVENARLEALNPQSRQEVLANAIEVFDRIVQAYLNLNQPEKALEYIERSKGRNLVELMTQKGLKPQGVSQETIDKLAKLKQQVVNEQIRLQHQSINQKLMRSDNLTPYVQDHSYLKEYQQELDTFITENITPYDPNFNLTQKVQPIPFKDIKSLTDNSTCLLQWDLTGENILAFIVSANEPVKVWQSSEKDRNKLIDNANNYRQLYYSEAEKKEWINQLPDLLQTFADTLHINEIISLIPETCQRLIIIPHWFLHIFPLHAFPIDNNRILQDKYDIQYAPSCQLLQITKQRPLNQLTNLFAIQNPTKDLIFTDLEVNIISTLFKKKEIIAKDNATESTVTTQIKASESHCYHFSCHGGFNPNNPLESALLLAKPDQLTLGEIFELNLKKSRLVVLSACETGLIDLKSISVSNEYIGLPAGFLFAGSSSVISSLWTVSDLSTSFLMMKLYEILLDNTQNISVPIALKTAQNWLRNLSSQEGIQYLETRIKPNLNQLYPNKPKSAERFYKGLVKRLNSAEYPFENPFYWAAFIASGL
ncbi:CHAT domain-containing protein [Crocosphaera sp.]|uniref:CHAT domain-containing protein n=1 Tax=Crocosphaera sp. TaxID=2729996 RepID=UPI003F29E067